MYQQYGFCWYRCSGEVNFAGAAVLLSGIAMIAVLLAAGAAIGWGASDFFGGDASGQDTPVFTVVAIAELLGTLVVAPVLITRGIPPPDSPQLLFAALAGVAVTCELGLIYRAIGRGDAFITAPVGALGTAATVGIGLIAGDPFSVTIAAGLLLALFGGGASAWTSPATRRPGGSPWRTAATCAVAAAAVATMLTCLHAAGRLDPYWATAVEHISTSVSAAIAAVAGDRGSLHRRLPGRKAMPKLGLIALAGTGGDLAYATASHSGALSIVAAISSLYPITTIALGRLLQGQRAARVQLAGITLALTGAVLLGATSH
jgi:drug/metabolite transporter (DMT)-like permease